MRLSHIWVSFFFSSQSPSNFQIFYSIYGIMALWVVNICSLVLISEYVLVLFLLQADRHTLRLLYYFCDVQDFGREITLNPGSYPLAARWPLGQLYNLWTSSCCKLGMWCWDDWNKRMLSAWHIVAAQWMVSWKKQSLENW